MSSRRAEPFTVIAWPPVPMPAAVRALAERLFMVLPRRGRVWTDGAALLLAAAGAVGLRFVLPLGPRLPGVLAAAAPVLGDVLWPVAGLVLGLAVTAACLAAFVQEAPPRQRTRV